MYTCLYLYLYLHLDVYLLLEALKHAAAEMQEDREIVLDAALGYVAVCMCMYMCVYIYIYREREIFICTYIHI